MVDSAHLFVLALLVFVFGLVSRVLSRGIVTGLLASAAVVLGSPHPEAFIYFQF